MPAPVAPYRQNRDETMTWIFVLPQYLAKPLHTLWHIASAPNHEQIAQPVLYLVRYLLLARRQNRAILNHIVR